MLKKTHSQSNIIWATSSFHFSIHFLCDGTLNESGYMLHSRAQTALHLLTLNIAQANIPGLFLKTIQPSVPDKHSKPVHPLFRHVWLYVQKSKMEQENRLIITQIGRRQKFDWTRRAAWSIYNCFHDAKCLHFTHADRKTHVQAMTGHNTRSLLGERGAAQADLILFKQATKENMSLK